MLQNGESDEYELWGCGKQIFSQFHANCIYTDCKNSKISKLLSSEEITAGSFIGLWYRIGGYLIIMIFVCMQKGKALSWMTRHQEYIKTENNSSPFWLNS